MARANGIVFPIVDLIGGGEQDTRDEWCVNGGRPFEPPADVRFFAGCGADIGDLKRGYVDPEITENPVFDKGNYSERWSEPMQPDEDQGDREVMERDWQFRTRNRRSKGFLTRPHIPTER